MISHYFTDTEWAEFNRWLDGVSLDKLTTAQRVYSSDLNAWRFRRALEDGAPKVIGGIHGAIASAFGGL